MPKIFAWCVGRGLFISGRTIMALLAGRAMLDGAFGATSPWMDVSLSASQRANLLVAQMTLEEKIAMVHGWSGPCVGNGTNNVRLGIPALHLQDGPAGVADGVQGVTALPAPILLAATWDPALARLYGTIIGTEDRGKGVHVSLGPMINMVRVPQGGRSFETFGEDPFLTSAIAAEDIRGIQSQQVIAGAKHFICNDQESWRGNEMTFVDERTLHEIYFPPFLAAARAGVGSMTSAYNGVNHYWCSESPLLGTKLKVMFGFRGFIDCDWGANFGMDLAVNNGLDLEMPYDTRFSSPLQTAIQSNSIAQPQLDDMVFRIFVPMFQFGIFDNPPAGAITNIVTTPAHTQFAYQTALQGMVLLKNSRGLLPLDTNAVHSIAICGSVASTHSIWVGGGSAQVYLPYYDDPLSAISNRAGAGITVTYEQGDTGGSITQAVMNAQMADVAIVCVGEQTGEGTDRSSLSLPADQDDLVSAVSAANPRTIVVLYEGAGTLMPWNDQVAAAFVAWYPGQENGRPLAALLFGDANPSGKLPVTFPAAADQVPANTLAQFPGTNLQVFYSEGLLMGYRWYDALGVAPQYPFGHGLSYTTFVYTNLNVGPVSPSGRVTVSCDIRNNGSMSGAEIAQLYLRFPASAGEPPRQLKGFKKVMLSPGAVGHVTFDLDWEDLAYYDAQARRWTVPTGTFSVMIGASSRDIRLNGFFNVSSRIPSSGVANCALFERTVASSMLATNFRATACTDGDPATSWASLPGDPQWVAVDLGAIRELVRVRLRWDTNYARSYSIQLSSDAVHWTSAYSTSNGVGGLEDLLVAGSGRYVRMYGTQSVSGSGYSLQEFEVFSAEPQLLPAISISGGENNTTVLSWPVSWGGRELLRNSWLNWGNFLLEQNLDALATNWVLLSQPPTTTSGSNFVILPRMPGRQAYRLKSPFP